jgi:hypothetical protein
MTMHGMFWRFPGQFSSGNSAGIRPRSAYLKVIGDYTRWKDQLVFGCDDSAQREFLNKRKAKGGIEGPGQSNSNLWFTSTTKPDELGPNTAEGAVWLNELVKAGESSEPMLFAGWPNRAAWVQNDGESPVAVTFEVDKKGDGKWTVLQKISVAPKSATRLDFKSNQTGEWIRLTSDKATRASAHFYYSADDQRTMKSSSIFAGLSSVSSAKSSAGIIYGLGDDRRALGMVAMEYDGAAAREIGYYELDAQMNLAPKNDPATLAMISKFAIPQKVVTVDESSVLVVDDKGRRWRLPLGDNAFTGLTDGGALRICREVATERDLFNCHGTFYELPAENADGYAKIRPVASHQLRINDYASYRGLLVMTGIDIKSAKANSHVVVSKDQKAAVWAGAIDDLWQLGKPTGHGGPWHHSKVAKGETSDPYLIGFYDKKSLSLSHKGNQPVTFTMEADPVGNGPWLAYKSFTVQPGETVKFEFPKEFASRWIRFKADKACEATTELVYR